MTAVTGAANGAILNVGTGIETSIPDLVTTAEWVTGATMVPAADAHPGTPPRREHWLADPSLAAHLLGWRSSITLEEGLRMMWEGKQ
jgi:nucleoside-diphosphate-sugar epimerase